VAGATVAGAEVVAAGPHEDSSIVAATKRLNRTNIERFITSLSP
jgi:hypothetical protein